MKWNVKLIFLNIEAKDSTSRANKIKTSLSEIKNNNTLETVWRCRNYRIFLIIKRNLMKFMSLNILTASTNNISSTKKKLNHKSSFICYIASIFNTNPTKPRTQSHPRPRSFIYIVHGLTVPLSADSSQRVVHKSAICLLAMQIPGHRPLYWTCDHNLYCHVSTPCCLNYCPNNLVRICILLPCSM